MVQASPDCRVRARKIVTTIRVAFAVTALALGLLSPSPADAFDHYSAISAANVAGPIPVVAWVRPNVTPADRARVIGDIQAGLQLWQNIPTSALSFAPIQVIQSATEPTIFPGQLLVVVANEADLTSQTATLPSGGNPGRWLGAVADDPGLPMVTIAAHEIGHAFGFAHSTISNAFAGYPRPMMHWFLPNGPAVLQPDDIAAATYLYPSPINPPSAVFGSIEGRLINAATGQPLTGVNVVATTPGGAPVVSRVSGSNAAPGVFEIPALVPAAYSVMLLDGNSFRGSFVGLNQSVGLGGGFQADNLLTSTAGTVQVGVGIATVLGDFMVQVAPMTVTSYHEGPLGPPPLPEQLQLEDLTGTLLPIGTLQQPYEIWLQIDGGVRPISGSVSGLPTGFTGAIVEDPRTWVEGVHGKQFVHIAGTPQSGSVSTLLLDLTDAHGVSTTVVVTLDTPPPCAPPVVLSDPVAWSGCVGESTTLSVQATGGSPLQYQWRRNGFTIPGETSSNFVIAGADSQDVGTYDCVVFNPCGSVSSATADVMIFAETAITTQPQSASVCDGTSATLSLNATGVGLTYQWRSDGQPIAGATTNTLIIDPVTAADNGSYDCLVNGTCGMTVSQSATLSVATCGVEFPRGDCNIDGAFDIADAVSLLLFLFPGGGAPTPLNCRDACDCNDDEALDIADAVCALGALFGTPTTPPPAPYPDCGFDPAGDALGCVTYPNCP